MTSSHRGGSILLAISSLFLRLNKKFSILHKACSFIGSERIRNRATMGGNICNAAPSADSASSLLCLGARAIVAHIGGTRVIPMESFFRGPGQTALDDDELLVEIEIPMAPARSAGCYFRHTTRAEMDIAVVGVASFLVQAPKREKCIEARIALGAVAPTPIRVPAAEAFLKTKTLNDEVIEKASLIAAGVALPSPMCAAQQNIAGK